MPDGQRSKRVSIRCTEGQHDVWSGAAWEEDVSLEEFLRRAADTRAVTGAPSTNPDGRSAQTIRLLIRHYEEMLRTIESYKGGSIEIIIVGLVGCVTGCCQSARAHELMHVFEEHVHL